MVLQFYIVFTVLFMQTLKFKPAYNNIAFLLPIEGGGVATPPPLDRKQVNFSIILRIILPVPIK